ncbi:hypothetical protein RHGRI_013944 [Rhododendron griersonianum]|uniref:Uncharacterized protein n=1 Tax=Rhododendron griersonianum TaxID=479676 RepID=A0AAV6K7G6_9ERIC|nr:hypothetical protein RHGRI_013944 [Rhododendron griersonianum]
MPVVNRILKLRKKAALEPTDMMEVYFKSLDEDEPTDMVEVYFKSLDEDESTSQQILNSQEQYIRDVLGSYLLPPTTMPPHAITWWRMAVPTGGKREQNSKKEQERKRHILDYTKYEALEAFGDLGDDEELGPVDWPTVKRYITSLNDVEGERVHPHSVSGDDNKLDSTNLKNIRIRLLNGNIWYVVTECKKLLLFEYRVARSLGQSYWVNVGKPQQYLPGIVGSESKCGFLPFSRYMSEGNVVKKRIARFRMHQSLKLHEREVMISRRHRILGRKRGHCRGQGLTRIGDLFVMWPADCCVAFSFRVADKYVADVETREPISSRSHGIMRTEEIGDAKIAEVDLIAERFLP